MRILLFIMLLLFPVSAIAQTMWPVPQRDGTIVYVPMGTGNPPLWMTPDGHGGNTMIPNGVGNMSRPAPPVLYFEPPLRVQPAPSTPGHYTTIYDLPPAQFADPWGKR